MTPDIETVKQFQDAFRAEQYDKPTMPSIQGQHLRVQLIQEELSELSHALAAGDLVAVADALCDLKYVVDGAFLTFGMAPLAAALMGEVHRSNMSKLDEQGNPILNEAGRVVKGPRFSPPDLRSIVEAHL